MSKSVASSIESMAKKLSAAVLQQPWRPSPSSSLSPPFSFSSSSSSSSPRFLQSLLSHPENRLSPHEREEHPCLQKNEEDPKIRELLFFSSSPPVPLQDLHKSVPESLPWPKIDDERFPSLERDLHRCSFIDLERIWRLTTNSNYLPAPSEEVQEVILPGQHEDTASPMLMHTKRTFNPSTIVRKRRHGFLARKSTVGGRRVLARRLAKGRRILSA